MVSFTNPIIVIAALIQIANTISIGLDINEVDYEKPRNPVILVPGLEGSRLEVKALSNFPCLLASDYYFQLWINELLLLPTTINCFLDLYTYRPPTSKQLTIVRAPDFGGTKAIEDLSSNPLLSATVDTSAQYMLNLVQTLTDSGYVRDVTLRGAPYDFRLSPYELKDDYFVKLDGLINETYQANGGRRSVLICHSMGCTLMLAYLKDKPQAWKDTYIERLITVAAPFGGTFKAFQSIAVGVNFIGVSIYDNSTFRDSEQTLPSLAFLSPFAKVFEDSVLIETPDRKYRATEYPAIFKFLNATQSYKNWNNSKDIIPEIPFPGVNITCIYSTGLETANSIKFESNDYKSNYTVLQGAGDGTVNLPSLQYCHKWVNMYPTYDIQIYTFKDISHYDMIRDDRPVDFITELLTAKK